MKCIYQKIFFDMYLLLFFIYKVADIISCDCVGGITFTE